MDNARRILMCWSCDDDDDDDEKRRAKSFTLHVFFPDPIFISLHATHYGVSTQIFVHHHCEK